MQGVRRHLLVLLTTIAVPVSALAPSNVWPTASNKEAIPPRASLTIVLAGGGQGAVYDEPDSINCGVDCSADLTIGWRVYLEPVPYQGSRFIGWSGGGCSGISVCVVELQADTSITATFEPEPTAANPACPSNTESNPSPQRPPRQPPHKVQRLKCGRGTRRRELPNGVAESVRVERRRRH